MNDNLTVPQVAMTGVIAAFGSLWGKIGWLIVLWGVAMGLDYLTGTLAALHTKTWSSEKAIEGIWHKAGMLVVVAVAGLFDVGIRHIATSTGIVLPFEVLALPIILSWYIITELGSILENAVKMGAEHVPSWLKNGLAITANVIDSAGEKAVGGGDKSAKKPTENNEDGDDDG